MRLSTQLKCAFLYFMFFLPFLLTACGGGGVCNDANKAVDLVVTTVTPADGAKDVSQKTNIQVTFNQEIDASSAAQDGVAMLTNSGNITTSVALKLQAVSDNNRTLTYRLDDGVILESYSVYQFKLNLSILKNASGQVFGSGFLLASSFTTGDSVAPSVVIISPANAAVNIYYS